MASLLVLSDGLGAFLIGDVTKTIALLLVRIQIRHEKSRNVYNGMKKNELVFAYIISGQTPIFVFLSLQKHANILDRGGCDKWYTRQKLQSCKISRNIADKPLTGYDGACLPGLRRDRLSTSL